MRRNSVKYMTALALTALWMTAFPFLAQADGPSGPASDPGIAARAEEGTGPAAWAENMTAGQGTEGSGQAAAPQGTGGSGQAAAPQGTEGSGQAAAPQGTEGSGQAAAPQGTEGGGQAAAPQGTEENGQAAPQDPAAQGLVLSGGRYLDPDAPMIALTFDDGPYAPVGNRIMDCAEQYGGRVTFFVVGNRVASYRDEILRMQQNGHEIGNHTYEHKYLNRLNADGVRRQVEACNQAVASVTGSAPALVRLPGGLKNETVLQNISQPIIMWNVDTLDWKTRDAAQTVQAVLGKVKDGDIVLMHELYGASGDAACTLIPALTAQGYQLVTVSELAQFRGGVQGGKLYYSFRR